MEDFKIKINEYIQEFIETHTFAGISLEKAFEEYLDSEYSWQCTMFFKGYRTYVINFYMSKRSVDLEVNYIILTKTHIDLLASL